MTGPVAGVLADTLSRERVRVVAGLARTTGDLDLAEDCLQDAVERALRSWPQIGVPDNPAAWLTTAARRRAVDVLRRRATERAKVAAVAVEREQAPPEDWGKDDRLTLLLACCHPALPMPGRVALTLQVVGGLTTREIARAFLVSEATMGQRLLRTKNKVAHAGIRLSVPEPHRVEQRIDGVLAVVYLVFTHAYAAPADGRDLAAEALRLADLLVELVPEHDETLSLHALLLLQHSRAAARVDGDGVLVALEDQDRGRWDRTMVAAGLARLHQARATGRPPGAYRLQAEIAALHATAASPEVTDWARVVVAYDALLAATGSPVVALNRAVAVGMRDGADAGLALLDGLADRLADHPPLLAVRADLLRRAGRREDAVDAYRAAWAAAATDPERRALARRLEDLTGPVERFA